MNRLPVPITPPAPPTVKTGRRRRRGRLILWGLALAILALAAVLGGVWGLARSEYSGHLAAARSACADGDLTVAIDHLEQCERTHPDDKPVLLLAARVAWQSNNQEKAESLLDRYWQLYGDDDDLTFERLLFKAAAEDIDGVVMALRSRAEAGGQVADLCRYAVTIGLLRDYRYADAQRLLDDWRGEAPDSTLAALLQGKLKEHLMQSPQAAETFESVLAAHPEHADARLRLVRMLMDQRKADEALAHLDVLRARFPKHPEVMLQRALALRQTGRTAEAASVLNEVLETSPDSPVALTERAAIALSDGNDRLAADLLERAVQADPGSIGGRNLLIQAYTRLGRTADVAREEERVRVLTADSTRLTELTHGPLQTRLNDPGPPAEIAAIALRAGQVKEAIHWYQVAIKRDPTHAPSHTALAVIYREMGNPVLATKHRALAAGGK